ncbi:coatomer subunit delta isoform X1 [Arachis hypogaea]|uniref:coatomer subunit delta isoform X1 n=1 Tax=Arachis hypogaea TaxID=3818 RepID=UPI000DEC9363|nr:coatomer subunit delta isoform X1 [Arachis hypogaea]XP_025694902.1 coatomer subunit delta isoform X1 [Arachis hypogaea]XP_025694903.1 coatomer subunit delta isoform X1 [Arachis hypogaea]
MWAATWLYMATRKPAYLKYIQEESISASVTEFNWDLKYAGAQIFLTKLKMGICNQDAVKQLQSMMENEHASENEIDIVLSVPEYSDYFEESICKCAFDLILISLGHKENVTVTQVKQYCEMESHEEKLHRQMREDKIREAKDEMKRKANEIDKNKIIKNRGDNYKGGFGPLQSMGSGIFENSFNDTSISSSGTGSRLSSDVDSFSTKSKDRI